MQIAGRIAALTMLGNRGVIVTSRGTTASITKPGEISLQELSGGWEFEGDSRFDIGETEIRDALRTGLFKPDDGERMVWAHQTYAEFLAAWYLVKHKVATETIMSVLVHPEWCILQISD
jgi:hypothetical protein